MNAKKILALLLGAMMLLSLAACGSKGQRQAGGYERRRLRHDRRAENHRGGARPAQGAAGAGERAPVGNTELWEKVFMEADKGMAMIEDGKNLRRLPVGYRRGR
mgnify:CR=1 FL=1